MRRRVALAKADQLQPIARDFTDAQHDAAANRSTVGVKMPTGDAGKRQAEAFAALAQTVDGAFERLSVFGRKPGAKAQYA
ncbi:MAG: hypothetical protein FD148_2449, partial [Methylocystaceae bacterium]